jgi:hypothetical protein
VSSQNIHFSSASDRWATPKAVYDSLDAEFGFNFDPCPLDGDSDGRSSLFCEWRGKRVFCNPPYGPEIPKFLARAPEAEVAVFLIPARTDTRWFHDMVLPKAKEIRFLRGRLKFGDSTNCAPFPSMVVVYDSKPRPLLPSGENFAGFSVHSDESGWLLPLQDFMEDWIRRYGD